MEPAQSKDLSPEGFVQPTSDKLKEVQLQIEKSQFDAALTSIGTLKFEAGTSDFLWSKYFAGLAQFGKKDLDAGFKELNSIYEFVRQSKQKISPDIYRLLGASLKKVGWYYRSKKDFDRAYAYHSIEFSYFEKHGSPIEIHDAAISLDVDSYSLGDMRLSESWLLKGIEAAKRIRDAKSQAHSLGVSYNNIAGTLYSLERFEEAEIAIKKSLDHWKACEALAGSNEFKVVWAYYGVGDVFENWANHLKKQGANYDSKKTLAIQAYRTSLDLGDKLGLSPEDKKSIQERISVVSAL